MHRQRKRTDERENSIEPQGPHSKSIDHPQPVHRSFSSGTVKKPNLGESLGQERLEAQSLCSVHLAGQLYSTSLSINSAAGLSLFGNFLEHLGKVGERRRYTHQSIHSRIKIIRTGAWLSKSEVWWVCVRHATSTAKVPSPLSFRVSAPSTSSSKPPLPI